MAHQQTRWSQFGVLITVFFFWGFVAASNDILIPVFKKAFNLSQAQSQLVSLAFYVAYTVGSLIYFLTSKLRRRRAQPDRSANSTRLRGRSMSASNTSRSMRLPSRKSASVVQPARLASPR